MVAFEQLYEGLMAHLVDLLAVIGVGCGPDVYVGGVGVVDVA